jgi:hypothetical protein
MDTACSSEMSVVFEQAMWSYSPEDTSRLPEQK